MNTTPARPVPPPHSTEPQTRTSLPVLTGACGCNPGCRCGCQSGAPCQCGATAGGCCGGH